MHTLFESKGRLTTERVKAINEEISLIEERISYYEREHLESQAELDLIKTNKQNGASRYYQGHPKWRE